MQPDEYFHESYHLIYCVKCHTPRQGRYTLQGSVFMPPIRCKCRQELYDQEETKRKLLEKQSEIERMKARSSGLLLWGNVGTGKSFFAGCIANALLEKGVPVLMTNFSRILNTLTGMHFEDRNQFIDSLNRYSLLIIDDMGIERNSEFALEQVFNVIDSRNGTKNR